MAAEDETVQETAEVELPDTGYFRHLLDRALTAARVKPRAPLVLDVRAGDGRTLFPCLQMFPDGHMVAADPDPSRLPEARRVVDQVPEWRTRVTWLAGRPAADSARRGLFDLVLGASHLNRLADPRLALREAARVLRPGGTAIFFEPFENGHAILRVAYKEILAAPGAAALPPELATFLEGLVANFGSRSGSRRPPEVLAELDAKWLFTRRYLEESADLVGFASIDILPLQGIEDLFAKQTEAMLAQGMGATPDILPDWAWEVIARYEEAFSDDLKYDLQLEGAIILRA